MKQLDKPASVNRAAAAAGMACKMARKYARLGKLPSELAAVQREWSTREDPFVADWSWAAKKLAKAPGLEAKTLF